ncbi:MAG: helix-turn-helix transcriptional regulator [Chloroflexota bacterium]
MEPASLTTDVAQCQRVASYFRWQVRPADRDDLVQGVLLEIQEELRRNGCGLSDKELWRAARRVRDRYWRAYKRDQRVMTLNAILADGKTELWELVPDDKAPDLDAWLDARLQLEKCPPQVLAIAAKRASGIALTGAERHCLQRFSRKRLGRPPRVLVPVAGLRIKEQRERLGWNINQLAKRARISRKNISRYEHGERSTAEHGILGKLAGALGVSPDYLTRTDPMKGG